MYEEVDDGSILTDRELHRLLVVSCDRVSKNTEEKGGDFSYQLW